MRRYSTGKPRRTYYFDNTSGSDTNLGTSPSSPFQTLTKANALVLNPGDRVLFKRGETWTGTTTSLNTYYSGKESAYIYYGAYGSGANPIINRTTGTAIEITKDYLIFSNIDGTNSVQNYRVTDAHHVTIRNCDLQANTTSESSINIPSTANNRTYAIIVEYCTIHDTPGWGITAGGNTYQGRDITVRGCTITDIGASAAVQHHGIYFTSVTGVLFENNIVDNCYNSGISLKSNNGNKAGGIIRRNKITRSGRSTVDGPGIALDNVREGCIVENNHIADGTGTAGIWCLTAYSSNLQIYNNTIVRNNFGINFVTGCTGVTVKNNIVIQDMAWLANSNRTPLNLDTAGDLANMTFNNNLWFFKDGAGSQNPINLGGTKMSFATWKTQTGTPDLSGLSVDPVFVTAFTNLHLQSGSTARGAGTSLGDLARSDLDGTPLDSTPDMGCYQYV